MQFVLHLAPSDVSGVMNTCPKATDGCKFSCLNLAGRGGMFKKDETTNRVQAARIRKTKLFFESKDAFMTLLEADIRKAISYAEKRGFTPTFRLNATSDIQWRKYKVPSTKLNIFDTFPDIQFYDYTAIFSTANLAIKNYHLTFSAKENNDSDVEKALAHGMNVAVVFDVPKSKPLPLTYLGRPVVDFDVDDLRFLDSPNVIGGLHLKGWAGARKHARDSGFAKQVIPIKLL